MRDPNARSSRLPWLAALIAALLSAGSFLLEGNVGINFSDEGWLWSGLEAFKQGAIPIRDFHSYDPGRYVWLVPTSYVFGDGVISLRAGCVLFGFIGMWCGLLAASRISRDWRFLLLVGLAVSAWMQPQYKVFEQAISLMGIYVAVRLIERPTLRQHALSGGFVGLMAFVGRNHGAYLAAAFILIILYLGRGGWKSLPLRLLTWGGGVFVGYLPQIAFATFVPGYFSAYLKQLRSDIAIGTNLAKSVPWPWRIPEEAEGLDALSAVAEGCFYLALPLGLLTLAIVLFRLPYRTVLQHPVLLAASCVALTYAHHTFSRADWVHLAHSTPALALAVIASSAALHSPKWLPYVTSSVLLAGGALAMVPRMSFVSELREPTGTFVPVVVRGQTLHVHLYSALLLRLADRVANQLAKPNEPVVFLPHWAGLYPATGRTSPLWETYFVVPSTAEEEAVTLAAMEKHHVGWVVLQDHRLDDREDLRFRYTNPRTFAYLERHFRPVEMPGFPPIATVLRRIESGVTSTE